MNTDKERSKKYKKDEVSENVLKLMNHALYSKELELIQQFNNPEKPVIFIIGAQRSGTTLLMQLITQLFNVSYPNNFIARYWDVPYIGSILYKSITKSLNKSNLNLSSDLGYTSGLDGPHEFGYFWKKWFPWESWEKKEYDNIDYSILQKQLAAWESVNNTYLVFKNLIQVSRVVKKIYSLFPNSYFIYLKRDLKFNVQSTYQSRIRMYGNENQWFGVKPSNFNELLNLPVIEQITKQILTINEDIEKQLLNIPKNNVIRINYEDLVVNYRKEVKKITDKINLSEKILKPEIKLISANKINVKIDIFDKILKAVEKYSD